MFAEDLTISANSVLDLSGLLTVRTISEGKKALWNSLRTSVPLRLVISEDADVDILGIQLILAAKVYAQSAAADLSLAAPLSGRALSTLERGGFLAAMSAEDRRFWLREGA